MPVAAALYCRISRDAERRGLGVARQEQDLVALAERKGWDVQDVYVDNDISAARKAGVTAQRPRYGAMLDAIRDGRVQAVAVWDQDRLVRDPMELEQFLVELAPFANPGALAAAWPGLSFERRRSVLSLVIDRIVVAPTTRAGNKVRPYPPGRRMEALRALPAADWGAEIGRRRRDGRRGRTQPPGRVPPPWRRPPACRPVG